MNPKLFVLLCGFVVFSICVNLAISFSYVIFNGVGSYHKPKKEKHVNHYKHDELVLEYSLHVLVALFGVVPRSIRYTWESINKEIVEPLKNNGSKVSIYVFNLDVENSKVDGEILNQYEVNIIPYTDYETQTQRLVDEELNQNKCSNNSCVWRWDYPIHQQMNAMRQLYSEQQIGNFLRQNYKKNQYDVVVVTGPDYYFPRISTININDVFSAANSKDIAYTTTQNDAEGYTNGFYIGHPETLIKILNRYDDFDSLYRHIQRDYEKLVKRAFENYGIERKVTEMMFFKVRATKDWNGRSIFVNVNFVWRRRKKWDC